MFYLPKASCQSPECSGTPEASIACSVRENASKPSAVDAVTSALRALSRWVFLSQAHSLLPPTAFTPAPARSSMCRKWTSYWIVKLAVSGASIAWSDFSARFMGSNEDIAFDGRGHQASSSNLVLTWA